MTDLDGIRVVSNVSEKRLNKRQLVDYRDRREDCLKWLLTFGKDPETVTGYARQTVMHRTYRMDQFYRWVWDEEDRYVSQPSREHADEFLRYQAQRDTSNEDKSCHRRALLMLFKWLHHEHGVEEWEPPFTFNTGGTTNPRDFLTKEERSLIREASLEYGSIPSYKSVTPEERDRWKAYLAQRYEIPKFEVTPQHWERANGWKIPSLVMTSLDTGLRPIEVERSQVHWIDIQNQLLRIPKEESSKNRDYWKVSITDRTAKALRRWLEQREYIEMYNDTDEVWLTDRGNPYQSGSLSKVMDRLCNIAGIETESRQMSWYTIRHSVGTYMTRERGLAAAQAQLRHKSPQTTMKYDQVPVEDRRDALEKMG